VSRLVFAAIGALLLITSLVLGILGSFAYIAIASVGMFFIAAALVARAIPSPEGRAPAVLALAALAFVVFGMTALGWGILAGAALLALLNARRAGTQR
jgi:hypothetical protein